VLPLDDRGRERMVDPARPAAFERRERYRYYPGTSPVPSNTRPALLNRSHRIIATVEVSPGACDGTLCAVGSAIGGWVLFVRDGHPHYVHNALTMHDDVLRAQAPLTPGRHVIELAFTAVERGIGRARLSVDEHEVVGDTLVRTAPLMTSPMHEGLMIGRLWGSSPASRHCESPFDFAGRIDHVDLVLGPMLDLPPITGRAE
jgi:arylsulfatase